MRTIIVSILLLSSWDASAANAITASNLVVNPLHQTAEVIAAFSGDDNANATATGYWRRNGQSIWRPTLAGTNFYDRASTRAGGNNATNQNQWRMILLGLVPNTAYQVRVDWIDPDGGSANFTNNFLTLPYLADVPTNGNIIPVQNGDTLSTKIASANAGDTLIVSNGSYSGNFTWSKSGNASGWIVVKAALGHLPLISGGSFDANLTISASYVALDGFRFTAATNRGIYAQNSDHVYLGRLQLTNCCTTLGGNNADIDLESSTNAFVYGCILTGPTLQPPGTADGEGIRVAGATYNISIESNTIAYHWDGIGGGGNYGIGQGLHNASIWGNIITNNGDDQIELDGDCRSVAVIGNVFGGTNLTDAISLAPAYVGPFVIARNTIDVRNTSGAYGVKGGNNYDAVGGLVAHNLISTFNNGAGASPALSESGGPAYTRRIVHLNNILMARGNAIELGNSTNSYNYNCYTNTVGTDLIYRWNFGASPGADYSTLAAWSSGTSQEPNGIYANPQVVDWIAGTLSSDSFAIDRGMSIPGLNDIYSRWPFGGAAPDIGSAEANAVAWDEGIDASPGIQARIGTGRPTKPVR